MYAILELNDWSWVAVEYTPKDDHRMDATRAGLAALDQEFVVYSVKHTQERAAELVERRNSGRSTSYAMRNGKLVFLRRVRDMERVRMVPE